MDKSIEAAARAMYRYHNLREASNDAWRLYESEARAAIAAYRDAEAKQSDRCEHCGSIVTNYRNGCPGCGAPQCCQRCCDKAEIERLTAENDKLLGVLEQHGFRRCDIAACNCGSWHHIGGFAARFREIEEATEDYWENGEVLLARIERIVAKLEAAECDAERYREWKRAFREGEVGLWNAICEANSDAEHDAAIDAARGGERG